MTVEMQLSIPLHFFDSAKAENHFESVSERIAKMFLKQVLKIKDIRRGNADIHEPDYIAGQSGFEVTFAIESSLIPILKGLKPLDGGKRNIEDKLIKDIEEACKRKSEKTYSWPISLVIISIDAYLVWQSSLYFDEKPPFAQMIWRVYNRRRDELFRRLNNDYLETNSFENIFIIQSTHDESFAFYDIKKFVQNAKDYVLYVKPNRPEMFPTYRVINIKNDTDGFNFETKVIDYIE